MPKNITRDDFIDCATYCLELAQETLTAEELMARFDPSGLALAVDYIRDEEYEEETESLVCRYFEYDIIRNIIRYAITAGILSRAYDRATGIRPLSSESAAFLLRELEKEVIK